MKMHENELEVSLGLVQELIKSQCPQWANLPLMALPSNGTDHVLFRLGYKYVVRLPRVNGAESINKEYAWLPEIARYLKVPISEPLFKGSPTAFYPWPRMAGVFV
jgi:aminoglycoside phosphotransferase (APT) family kinase protein